MESRVVVRLSVNEHPKMRHSHHATAPSFAVPALIE